MSPSSLQLSFQEHARSPPALPWRHLVGGGCTSLPCPWVGVGSTSLRSVGQRVPEPLSGPLLSSRGVERKCRVLAPAYTVRVWSRASRGWACPYKVWHSSQLLTWPCIGSHRHWASHFDCPTAIDDGVTTTIPWVLTWWFRHQSPCLSSRHVRNMRPL